ncbi:hypothetical protein WMF27_22980 [Sorangium sp. So ce281]|uniref:hypothetical protein n=1 Tax=unclassified Sorangium TaxID=2621164 RepID=UPI003F5EBC76
MVQLSRAEQVAALARVIAALDARPAPHFDAFAALFHGHGRLREDDGRMFSIDAPRAPGCNRGEFTEG